jgi:hypothetical protein
MTGMTAFTLQRSIEKALLETISKPMNIRNDAEGREVLCRAIEGVIPSLKNDWRAHIELRPKGEGILFVPKDKEGLRIIEIFYDLPEGVCVSVDEDGSVTIKLSEAITVKIQAALL